MGDLKIKEIANFTENGQNKTRIIVLEDDIEKEIILEGDGALMATVEV